MKKEYLAIFLFLIFFPISTNAAMKTVTIDWTMADTSGIQAYRMYYSYNNTMTNKRLACETNNPTATTLTCENIDLELSPVYLVIAAVFQGSETASTSVEETFISEIAMVEDFKFERADSGNPPVDNNDPFPVDNEPPTTATFYSSLDSLQDLVSPPIGQGGTATADVTFTPGVNGNALTKGPTTTSGFEIPASNANTQKFTIAFDFIPSHDSNDSVFGERVTILNINYGTYSSLQLRGGNGFGANWEWLLEIIDDSLTKHTCSTGFSSSHRFSEGEAIHVQLSVDPQAGTIEMRINGETVAGESDNAFSMHEDWARSSASSISFFGAGLHSSKIDELTIY